MLLTNIPIYDWVQIALYLTIVLLLVKPLGGFMATVYQGNGKRYLPFLSPIEGFIYRLSGVDPNKGMSWRSYAGSIIIFSLCGFLFLYAVLLLQHIFGLNPEKLPGVTLDLAFNIAASFITNTNWQSYGGETTLSYFSQMVGITVQNFISASCGMAVLVALIRGFVGEKTGLIGNFWADLVRGTLYILLPLSLLLALVLVSQGVVQNISNHTATELIEPVNATEPITTQLMAMGPVASQVAIKQLGTNGGGFFNTNSAHPFENPTPLSNFLQMLAILLIPAALCYTYGVMVGDTRQGWVLLSAMVLIFIPMMLFAVFVEQSGNPLHHALGVVGSNMEGKEVRFGSTNSALWASATTAASNGSVNAMHSSFMPLAGLVPMLLMQFGEVIFGGVGSGLYGMVLLVLLTVFVSGLMVGRTPEYLGKKIQAFEMKMVALAILAPTMAVLMGAAIAVLVEAGKSATFNQGAMAFSEILYAFTSAGMNNGSAFAGLSANSPFYNYLLGFAMLIGRFGVMIPVLAIAGALAEKKKIPQSGGTLPTHTPFFTLLLSIMVLIIGMLTFIPSLALGPIAEHLHLHSLITGK